MTDDAPCRQISLLLPLGILQEHWVHCIYNHFCLSGRLCIFIFTGLFTQLNGNHIDVLGKGRHQCCKSLVFLALGVALQQEVSLLAFIVTMTTAATITLNMALANIALLGGEELHPFFASVADKEHLKIVPFIILDLEGLRGTAANASNVKLLVDLLMKNLIYQVLNSDINIARVLVMVSIKQQLGLSK